ncbi:hypothetical protein V8G54_015815, partial [Vigna mungo]
TTSPDIGEFISLDAFTLSTAPNPELFDTVTPASGSSTNTTSPRWPWAWSVIPMVATGPSCLTHSCDSAYLSPSKTVDKHLEKEKGGRRWGLEAEESLSALAVEEAH